VNPPDTLVLQAETVLVVMGDMNEVRRARHDAHDTAHEYTAGLQPLT